MGSNPIGVTNIVNMVTLAEWFRRKFVALVYVGSNPTRHPFFETIVYAKTFNPRMIGWQNAVAVKQ